MTTSPHRFAGVHSALVTPFDKYGEIDGDALLELIAIQRMDGIHGLVMAGSTGEAPTLTVPERERLVRIAKEHSHNMVVIAGAGSNCTKDAMEIQKAMENAGADATLQVVPYYNKPTQRGLFEHFSAIAKNACVPIILYNATGRTGIDITPATVSALAKEHQNIIGIKDANTDVERLSDLLRLTKSVRPDFLVLSGEDSAFLPYLTLGGDGTIAVTAQIATTEMLAIYNCVKNGDLIYAQKIAQKLNGLCKLLFSHSNPIPIKTILSAMGLIEKSWRLPLCALSSEEENHVLSQCHNFAFIKNFKSRGFCQ